MRILSLVSILFFAAVFAATDDFNAHLIELDGFQNRAGSIEKKIRELVAQTKVTKDKARIQSLTHEIVENHEEMEKLIKRADKLRNHMKYEHPEKGEVFDTRYPRLNRHSLKQLDSELGLDKILSELYKKVETTFPTEDNTDVCNGEHCVKKVATPTPGPSPASERIKISE